MQDGHPEKMFASNTRSVCNQGTRYHTLQIVMNTRYDREIPNGTGNINKREESEENEETLAPTEESSENAHRWELVRQEHANRARRNAIMISNEFMKIALRTRNKRVKLNRRKLRYRYIFTPQRLRCFVNLYVAVTICITAMIFGLCVVVIAHMDRANTLPNMISYATFVSAAWVISMACLGTCLKLVELGEELDEISI